MCYSAMVDQKLKDLSRRYDAVVDETAFEALFEDWMFDDGIKLSRALEDNYRRPDTDAGARIRELILQRRQRRRRELQSALFAQRQRLADAERKLAQRETRTAREHQRIATDKIRWIRARLADLTRETALADDRRIFPFWFAPVIVFDNGRRRIRPMRYHCRPAGKPAAVDRRFPGCYNARRDNLRGYWASQFGHTHALLIVDSFFENVARHDFEQRPLAPGEKSQNLILHFNPQPAAEMAVACVWSRWQAPQQPTLESFAAITDEPPSEIRATGHDRCVIPLKPEYIEAWLTPQGRSLEALDRMLDDRQRFFYAHRLAA